MCESILFTEVQNSGKSPSKFMETPLLEEFKRVGSTIQYKPDLLDNDTSFDIKRYLMNDVSRISKQGKHYTILVNYLS